MIETKPDKRMSWKEVLAALIPFLIYGPIRQLANIWLNPTGSGIAADNPLGVIIGVGLMSILILFSWGFGSTQKYPRWFYPYLGVLVMVPSAFVYSYIFGAIWNRSAATQDLLQAAAWAVSLLAFGGLIALLSNRLLWLRPLYASLQRDGSQLSLSVAFLAASTFTGLAGGPFNALVPPIFIIIAVTGSLLSHEKKFRMLWLLSGLFVGSVFRLAVHTTSLPWVIAWFVLMILPALFDLRRQDHENKK